MLSSSHTRIFNVLMPVGLHLMTMQTQVPRISIMHVVDPAEHSRVSDFGNGGNSGFGNSGNLGFDKVDSLGFGISRNSNFGKFGISGGKEIVVKDVIEEIDDEKKLIKKKVIEGDLLDYYKSFYVTIQVEIKGENNLVTWIMEYEKKNTNMPDPHTYMELCLSVTKDFGLTISSDA
ncbi:hypothetical protein MTR67_016342 [Solanum verrucosum]|uniref:Bet v I/Major latex protein domain-containing protein n=1 Tax=Solanum verrucosum TaxID=315347 RepID=A0AAF0TJK7_SOLVR|nr:hypothetical protein MTR67_016342 [Solanum verrucosum]